MKVAEYISENARISSPPPPRQSLFSLSGIFTAAFFAVWVNFPTAMRIFAYENLSYIGLRLYGGSISRGVQRLPFGLYLKRGVGSTFGGKEAEFGALQLVRQYTSIPVPRPLDLICTQKSSFLVTSRIEGECAGIYLDLYSDQEVAAMVDDLRQWVADLRAIPKAVNPDFAICNAVGKACLDYRVGGNDDHIGPCVNEEGFNQALRIGKFVHRSDHKIFFTHGDLNPRNVLVKNGRITGIVDWENAGWYPEYWEYIKCHFAIRHGLPRWIGIIEAVFDKENYAEELRIERGLWDFGVF
jgi:aminoglycoside phosphotransferase